MKKKYLNNIIYINEIFAYTFILDIPLALRGPHCLSCSYQLDPAQCHHLTTCQSDEVRYTCELQSLYTAFIYSISCYKQIQYYEEWKMSPVFFAQ